MDDLVPMNVDQAKKVPFPPSSLVYIYNNESPPYIMAAGEVKAVYLKLEFSITGGTQVFFEVELSPGMNSIGSDIYGENRKNVLMKASQLRFRNGCPVNVNIQMQESTEGSTTQKNVPGSVIGIYDVPSGNGNGRNKTGNTGYRYSIQVFENVPGLNSEEPRVLQNIKPELVRYRDEETEETRNGNEVTMRQVLSNSSSDRIASSSFAHHVKEEPQNVSTIEEEPQRISVGEEPAREAHIIKKDPAEAQPDRFYDGTASIQGELTNDTINTVYPNSPKAKKKRRLDFHCDVTLGAQGDDQYHGSSAGGYNYSDSIDDDGSMISEITSKTSPSQKRRRVSNENVDEFKRETPNQKSNPLLFPKSGIKLSNISFESDMKSDQKIAHVDLSQESEARQVHDYYSNSSTTSQHQEHNEWDKTGSSVTSNTDAGHWRYIPPERPEEHVKNVGAKTYYWHQQYNGGKGMWSMNRMQSIRSAASCRVIRIQGFKRHDFVNALIGAQGMNNKLLKRCTGLKTLRLKGTYTAPYIFIEEGRRGMDIDDAVEIILQKLRKELNFSSQDVKISFD